MFRRLDVRLIVMVTAVLVAAVGLTLYLIWWIDVNTVSTVTTGSGSSEMTVFEQTPTISQILAGTWPLLLIGVTAPVLVIVLPLIVRTVRPVREVAREAQALANTSGSGPESGRPTDDLHALTQSFQTIAAQLARTNQLRRNMLNDVAHELRHPLTNLQCQLEALQDGLAQPDAEMIQSLYEETMLLKRLAEDLHELALAEAGQLPLTFERTGVKELIHTAVQTMKPQIAAANQKIEIACDGDLGAIEADGERLQQVLRNLLSNAIRHTPSGGKIIVSAESTPEEILIRVQDSGAGLPPEALADVFERFYRVDPSRTRRTGGVGLGLAIVKQIVEAHHGRVWAENAPVQGAQFTISLPRTQPTVGRQRK